MNRLCLFLAAFVFVLGVTLPHAHAQVAAVVSACNASSFNAGENHPLQMTAGGVLCTASSGGGGGSVTQGTSPWVVSGTVTANAGTNLNTSALALDASVGTTNTRLSTINTTLGSPFQAGGALGAGSALIGKFGIDQTTPGTTNAVQPIAGTSGGCTPYHLAGGTAASTNSTSVKGSAGNLCDLTPINTTTTIYYLKVYDSASAPTCSSATNIKHVYPIPPAAAAGGAGGVVRGIPLGESYSNGIGFCVTGGGGDTDNTNAATGVYVEASYK